MTSRNGGSGGKIGYGEVENPIGWDLAKRGADISTRRQKSGKRDKPRGGRKPPPPKKRK